MSYMIIPRFKLSHPLDPTMPYLTVDGKIVECVIATNDDALVLQGTHHLMSCQQARKEKHGLSGFVFLRHITSIRGEIINGKLTQVKESFDVVKYLEKMGSTEIKFKPTKDMADTDKKAIQDLAQKAVKSATKKMLSGETTQNTVDTNKETMSIVTPGGDGVSNQTTSDCDNRAHDGSVAPDDKSTGQKQQIEIPKMTQSTKATAPVAKIEPKVMPKKLSAKPINVEQLSLFKKA